MNNRIALLLGAASLILAACSSDGAAGPPGAAGQVGAAGGGGQNGGTGAAGSVGATGAAGAAADGGSAEAGVTAPPIIASGVTTGLHVTIKPGDVSTKAGAPVTVRFTLTDDLGFPVDLHGVYSDNIPMSPRFALSYFTKDASGNVTPFKSYTASGTPASPTAYSPLGTAAGHGTITENGTHAGDYTYTFPTATTAAGPVAVAYDATKVNETHVVWILAARQTDSVYPTNAKTFYATDQSYYFVPSGASAPAKREIVLKANCDKCHNGFKPETSTANAPAFHNGDRIEPTFCSVCHSPDRTPVPAWPLAPADASSFVHRIHYGSKMPTANLFHGLAASYPQDIRNCDACHKGAAQSGQIITNPSRTACGSCHEQVSFAKPFQATATCTHPPAVDPNGILIPCNHKGGNMTDDTQCTQCHKPGGMVDSATIHAPVLAPNPTNIFTSPLDPAGGSCTGAASCVNGTYTSCVDGLCRDTTGKDANTNASYLSAAGYVPAGAAVITYKISKVELVPDAVTATTMRPRITFKLMKDGADVVFQDHAAASEIMANFVGSPTVYFAWAMPQDGIATPADFNVSASGYIKNIWNGTAVGAGAGTLTGPTAGYYQITLTNVAVQTASSGVPTMFTGGVGYGYSLATTWSGTTTPATSAIGGGAPLVQTNVAGFAYDATTKQGGLSVPAPNVWMVGVDSTAKAFTGRRPIVDNAKCQACHVTLGVAPTFHAGQRNDGSTCSFCHTPNRTSSAWSAGSRSFIHSIHAGRIRKDGFSWHATSATDTFADIEFPTALNDCKSCHVPNTYDFTAASALNAVPNLTLTTVATGKFDPAAATAFTNSPYVTQDNATSYGTGYSVSATTAAVTEATGNTAVISPIMTVCVACHDAKPARDHMTANGGQFYAARSTALAGPSEQCLICHGPGRTAAVGVVHGFQ